MSKRAARRRRGAQRATRRHPDATDHPRAPRPEPAAPSPREAAPNTDVLSVRLAATDEELPHATLAPVPREAGAYGRAVSALGSVFALAFLVVTAIILYEIVMRYAFNAPTIWVHETTSFLCGIGFVFGGLYALSTDKHIRVVLLYERVRGRAKRLLDMVLSAIGLVTMGFFAFAAWTTAEKAWFAPTGEFRLESTGSIFDPPYPALVKGFLLVVIVAMGVQFVILMVNHARGRTDGERPDPAEGRLP